MTTVSSGTHGQLSPPPSGLALPALPTPERAVASAQRPLPFPSLGPLSRAVLFADVGSGPQPPPPRAAWAAECRSLAEQRLAGVTLRLARENAASVPEEVFRHLSDAAFAWSCRASLVIHRSQAGLSRLRALSIPFAISKGAGIAGTHGGLGERPFSDLDVIVAPEHFRRALVALSDVGFREDVKSLQPWPSFDRWCREGVNLHTPEGGSIDLHHHLPPWYWGAGLTPARIIDRSTDLSIGGVVLPVASPTHNLLISALHVVSDRNQPGATLMAWRDLLILAAATDPGEVALEAAATGLDGWLLWLLQSVPYDVRPSALVRELQRSGTSLAGRRRLAFVTPPGLGSRHLLGQAFRLPVWQGALFVGGMIVPSRDFVEQKMGARPHPYRRWWRSLRAAYVSARS